MVRSYGSQPPEQDIELIQDRESLLAIRSDWLRLHTGLDDPPIFLSWEYVTSWLDAYGDGFELAVLLHRDSSGKILGIAPFVIGRGEKPFYHHLRHLGFLGSFCDSTVEYQDFLVERGYETELVPRFLSYVWRELSDRWDLLSFRIVREDSPSMKISLATLLEFGARPQVINRVASSHIELPKSFDTFLAAKSKNFRKQFRQSVRRVQRAFKMELHQVGREIELDEALDLLISLNQERWRGDSEAFCSQAYLKMHRSFAAELYRQDRLGLLLLRLNDRYVAAQYDFIDRTGKVWGFNTGRDPAYADHSVGNIITGLALEHYIESGYREYDFLAGDAAYKNSWRTATRSCIDIEAINPRSARARFFQSLRLARRWSKRIVSQLTSGREG